MERVTVMVSSWLNVIWNIVTDCMLHYLEYGDKSIGMKVG